MSTFLWGRRDGDWERYDSIAVLFLDIVGFTKQEHNEDLRRAVQELQVVVKDVVKAERWDVWPKKDTHVPEENDLIIMPTGDGCAIAFCPDKKDDLILSYAVQLSKRFSSLSPVRMGINRGPCFSYEDLNAHLAIGGWGINFAERVMSLGEDGHILCTKQFAESVMKSSPQHSGDMHDLGEYEVKHQYTIHVYNFYKKDEFGNPNAPRPPTVKKVK